MTPRIRKLFTFPIDDELADGLRRLEVRDGISKAEQIRRGIQMYLKAKGISVKAGRRPATTRKRGQRVNRVIGGFERNQRKQKGST